MKKLLSILLVIAMASAFFAGCGPKKSEGPTGPVGDFPTYDGTVLEFTVYDESDFQTRWTWASYELLEKKYGLKVSHPIAAVDQVDMSTKANRDLYTQQISLLFEDSATTPDFMPALKGSPVGADGVWKTIGARYLVDFNKFIGEGMLLENYTKYVWGMEDSELGIADDQRTYWEQAKLALEVEGALYVLPRRECRPIDQFLGYANVQLEGLGYTMDTTPSTWDGFVTLLQQFRAAKENASNIYPLATENFEAAILLQFIASTYGLNFSEDFEWTQKNGEPLWTYYWDEYLEILKDARSLAENNLVATDSKGGKKGVILNYDFDPKNTTYIQYKSKVAGALQKGSVIAGFMNTHMFAKYDSYGGQKLQDWQVARIPVAQEGYEYALKGKSQFDSQMQESHAGGYIAINKTNKELALRLVDYLNTGCSDEGFITYCFGKEGSIFADTLDEAGGYIKDENGKIHTWTDTRWGWENEKQVFIAYDERAAQFENELQLPQISLATGEGGGINYAKEAGVTEGGYWYADGQNFKSGIYMFADITAYPMRLTAYWNKIDPYCKGESFSIQQAAADNYIGNNVHVWDGMYIDPVARLGSVTGTDMQSKIDTLSSLAKKFTVDFLGGAVTEAAWETYINSLNQAGYKDVYEYYRQNAYAWADEYNESVSSQSDINAKRGV